MSDTNGHLPEWLRELGAKVDQLAEEGRRTDQRINALREHAQIQQEILDGILAALELQRNINDEHAERLRRMEKPR